MHESLIVDSGDCPPTASNDTIEFKTVARRNKWNGLHHVGPRRRLCSAVSHALMLLTSYCVLVKLSAIRPLQRMNAAGRIYPTPDRAVRSHGALRVNAALLASQLRSLPLHQCYTDRLACLSTSSRQRAAAAVSPSCIAGQ
jgi:hypothetical protein